jgi:hypothetical protein
MKEIYSIGINSPVTIIDEFDELLLSHKFTMTDNDDFDGLWKF